MQRATRIITSLSSYEGADNDDDRPEGVGPARDLEQFVSQVEDFSSQYGSEISISYTAHNLRGPPANFPDYGDYPQAFVMRTYGTWWEEAPSVQKNFMPQNAPAIQSQDFVVSFRTLVFPSEVAIFETYNPGALVRIWALGPLEWLLLWEGEPEYAGDKPRIFRPPIREIDYPVRILRLEFDHRLLPYYTELDAISIRGLEGRMCAIQSKIDHELAKRNKKKGPLLSSVLASRLHETVLTMPGAERKKKNRKSSRLLDIQQLPNETLLGIMRYLDLKSLCRCAQVNRHFRGLATDSLLYRSIDLRPYWYCVTSEVLTFMSMRCKRLQKLDLSWCGSHCMIRPHAMVEFLKHNGAALTHLRLNCCKFVNNCVIRAVGIYAPDLQELCLRSVETFSNYNDLLPLKKLRRLDLYRTHINTKAAVAILKANPGIQHLNLGACKMISMMDSIALVLGAYCRELVSVDFWKSFSLTGLGLRALANCTKLQEIDVGWCLQAGSSGEWLRAVTRGELRKLFLGALRGVSDADLRAILPRIKKLTQLDLLGVRAITPGICSEILDNCRELRLLDVSFCDQIDGFEVAEWRRQYPNVSIKRSFQSLNLTNSTPNPLFHAPNFE
ncbi:F-box/LRR-repeat protein 4 isoform X2 [Leptidea sinapis]|uniref:F-box/LRR-repeat protein 4 isoform X2 n=1 Tax=Leptidea sinapis TaxID=189913 RepID=UPI0021C3314F|nr:F-box/LRR-repeat protein 4 isoform X2 [Leptidea sinapis]